MNAKYGATLVKEATTRENLVCNDNEIEIRYFYTIIIAFIINKLRDKTFSQTRLFKVQFIQFVANDKLGIKLEIAVLVKGN